MSKVSSYWNKNNGKIEPVISVEEEEEADDDTCMNPGITIEPGEFHMSVFARHLSSIPEGKKSTGQVTMIRLLRKKAFMKEEIVQMCFQMLKSIGEGITLSEVPDNMKLPDESPLFFDISPSAAEALRDINTCAASWKEQLEDLLMWRIDSGGRTDGLFRVFDLSECPPFVYVSHRWAGGALRDQPLGVHCELIACLATCPLDYIWLDMGGCPQPEADRLQRPQSVGGEGETQQEDTVPTCPIPVHIDIDKVKWNMDKYLTHAACMSTFHSLDGLAVTGHHSLTEEGGYHLVPHHQITDGLLLVRNVVSTLSVEGSPPALQYEMYVRNIRAGDSLWCYFEQLFGKTCVGVTGGREGPPRKQDLVCADPLLTKRHEVLLRDRNRVNLQGTCPLDVEVLSGILYHHHYLPAVFTHTSLHCVDPNTDRLTSGVLLPDKNTTLEAIRMRGRKNMTYELETLCLSSFGWYYHWEEESWVLHIDWPQNKAHPVISMHCHKACILKCRERLVYLNLATEVLCLHTEGNYSYASLPCLLCRRRRTVDQSGVSSKTWICFVCKHVNEWAALSCSKCFEEELIRREASKIRTEVTSLADVFVGCEVSVREVKTKEISTGIVSRVYGTGMYDITYNDGRTEQYVDEDRIVLKPPDSQLEVSVYNDVEQKESPALERICDVCWFINTPYAASCAVCSYNLVEDSDNGRESECASPLPLGTKVTFRGRDKAGNITSRPGVICGVHRYGMYDIDATEGDRVSYIKEEEVLEEVQGTQEDWFCAGCHLLNAAGSIECKACNLQKGRVRSDLVFRFRDDALVMLGAKVDVRYHGGDKHYPGIIKNIRKNGTYDVEYDHGEVEMRVKEEHITIVGIFCGLFEKD